MSLELIDLGFSTLLMKRIKHSQRSQSLPVSSCATGTAQFYVKVFFQTCSLECFNVNKYIKLFQFFHKFSKQLLSTHNILHRTKACLALYVQLGGFMVSFGQCCVQRAIQHDVGSGGIDLAKQKHPEVVRLYGNDVIYDVR